MLDSVASQSGIRPVLYWRDDGSSDSTVDIVDTYRNAIETKRIPGSVRLGPCASFLQVLREATPHHASFHFADQDDIWHPGKVAHAHQAVIKSDTPRLFHCRQQLVDSNGQPLRLSRLNARGTFGNAMCENIAVGCTVAFNHAAATIIASGRPARSQMHDWWAYLVVSAVGEIWYDSREAMNASFQEPAYLEIIKPDELKFIDIAGCLSFIGDERVMFDGLSANGA